ncbi:MAG: hypothetical protein HYU34_00195 [Candidatus Omnitrophica bacterium]|nr:hypothetical protein [Candidatus Omnitrophota bacterium]
MISVQNISKDFGSFRALHNLSFDVTAGEVLGLSWVSWVPTAPAKPRSFEFSPVFSRPRREEFP